MPTRIEAKINDELGLGSNKVELRRHRVREEIRNSAKTENDLQKKKREIQLNRQESGAWNEGGYLRELYDDFDNWKTENIVM